MCKVMFIAGIKRQHQDKVKKLTEEMTKIISRYDDDGVGYAAITRDGKIYGEKWVRKDDAFILRSQPKPSVANHLMKSFLREAGKLKADVAEDKIYETFGVPRTKETLNNTVALILHARKKTTGEKNIQNTHPFFEPTNEHNPATALIHNGGIMNHHELTKKYSTCDSEVLLHEYLKNAMSYNPWGIEQLAKTVVGQYTVGVLTSTSDETNLSIPVLDIFKSNKDLYCAWVKEIETFVFCTSEMHLKDACEAAKLTCEAITEVNNGFYLRLNAITGEKHEDIIPFNLSRQFASEGTHSRGYPNTHIAGTTKAVGPYAGRVVDLRSTIAKTVEEAKRGFERNHSDLFESTYFDLGTGLTEEEKVYFAELEATPNVDLKAVRLVKKIMGM